MLIVKVRIRSGNGQVFFKCFFDFFEIIIRSVGDVNESFLFVSVRFVSSSGP